MTYEAYQKVPKLHFSEIFLASQREVRLVGFREDHLQGVKKNLASLTYHAQHNASSMGNGSER